jgi:ATP-binding cassette subfamily B multidrug efflux pump
MTPEAWIARWHGMDDAAIQESLDRLMAGKTVIAVAHRLSTLERMDRLVVLDHGRVAE